MEQRETPRTVLENGAGGLMEAAREAAARLAAAGFEAWFVGGCVRDRLLGLPLKDVDIATSARPEQAAPLFENAKFVGAKFGVLLVQVGGTTIEIATFRRDGLYLDHRHPETVEYGTQEDDARRRDFTINALYEHPESGEIRDFAGGQNDLRARLIRCVGNPHERFREDALRMLRAIRFATRLGFEIEGATWGALCDLAPTIEHISPERHRGELTPMLTGPAPGRALRMLDESGLLHFLLPEVEAMHGVEQGKRDHPEGDVFEHTCLVLEKMEPRTPITCWAGLLHDVAKPVTFKRIAGRITFHHHDNIGAEMARAIMERLRFPGDEIERVAAVVKAHMASRNFGEMRKSTMRRFFSRPTIEEDLAMHRADCLGSCGGLASWERLCALRAELADEETGSGALPAPLVTGHDLLALGLEPGPRFKELLARVQDLQLEGELATREEALEWLREHCSEGGPPA